MIDQELIDYVHECVSNGNSLPSHKATELLTNYIKLIEDSAEMHKEIARLKRANAHLSYQLENICNEEDEGVDE